MYGSHQEPTVARLADQLALAAKHLAQIEKARSVSAPFERHIPAMADALENARRELPRVVRNDGPAG